MKKTIICFVVLLSAVAVLISASSLYAAEEFEVLIAKGIDKINTGQFRDALEALKKALELRPDNPEAEFYTALAYARLGELSKAERLFQRIKEESDYAASVYLELGRIYFAWNECRRAERYLTTFKNLSDDKVQVGYADNMIENCIEQADAEKPYKLNLTTGIQYDSNVTLESTNPSIVDDVKRRDARGIILVNAGARVFKNRDMNMRVDYNFYQSLHFDLTNFNVHYHSLSPTFELTTSDYLKPSLQYKLEYIYFDEDTYGWIHNVITKVNVKQSIHYSLDGIYEYQFSDYEDTKTFPDNEDRRGDKNTLGVMQNFERDKIKGDIHYYYFDKRAQEAWWAYKGQKIGGALSYRIIEPLVVKVSADFSRRRHFREHFPQYNKRRVDEMEKYALSVQYALTDRMVVTLQESYTRNDSSIEDYDYKRNIVGLLFTYGVL